MIAYKIDIDGRKTVYRKKERKTSFEMDGWMMM